MQQENGGESCVSQQLFCKVSVVTLVLVEMEKNAHSQSNAVSFAVTIFLSGLTGSELRLFKNLSQSVSQSVSQEKIDKNLWFREFFVSLYSIVTLECFCGLPVQIPHVCQ